MCLGTPDRITDTSIMDDRLTNLDYAMRRIDIADAQITPSLFDELIAIQP